MKSVIIPLDFTIIFFCLFCSFEQIPAETICDINSPRGYTRASYSIFSYQSWLRGLPLKKDNKIIKYNSKTVSDRFYNVFAVVDMPLLYKEDIEQCADWSFRFWSEYHKDKGLLDRLYLFDYSGNKRYFKLSGRNYYSFLKNSMIYANSYSIKAGCAEVTSSDIRPGDMLVQNITGGIGHVSIILDVCRNSEGENLYLIGYSFMPAQQFHIEKADTRYGNSGWFTLEGYKLYLGERFDFGRPVIRRFI